MVLLLASPVALELARRLGERLARPDVPPISQLPPAVRERLVREAAAEAIVAALKTQEQVDPEPEAARSPQKGRQ